ncbi:MAG: L,D-transpeptidase family protein [Novosphingobium sp.]|nr:L,D-transpeptidase family protein [Novosphingobium sp.]
MHGSSVSRWAVALAAGIAVIAPAAAKDRAPQNLLPTQASPAPSATPSTSRTPTIPPAPVVESTPPTVEPSAQPTTPAPAASPSAPAVAVPTPPPAPVPVVEPVMHWGLADAKALLAVVQKIDREGLIAVDYQPDALAQALAGGEGPTLDDVASHSFAWLAEDLRDGRTPMDARVQWFAVDPDPDQMPTEGLMTKAIETHDIAGVLAGLAPRYPDYAALKAALAATPKADTKARDTIRINMDRWRWLPRELGQIYLITNVPEYQLRLTVNDRIVRTYRTVVGKPGKTATPQLAEKVEGVVFNPTWTVPQSIVVGEGLGARLAASPAAALREGYKVTKMADGTIIVVQQPGPKNSLGQLKIDMPNPHAIYLHDTPAKALFDAPVRAFSHGCIRTDRALELGMTMAMLGADLTQEQAVQNAVSGKYTRVTMTKTFPVYITYVTMGQDITGKLTKFTDIYGRDAPVIASFAAPRQLKTTQRTSKEAIIKLDNPL